MNNWEIVRKLSTAGQEMIARLEKEGWKFSGDHWASNHNGDQYDDVSFQSPRMKKPASIDENRWKEVTEEYLLEREAWHAANDWANDVFHYTSVITNPLTRELSEYFVKKKGVNFSSLYASDVKFDVKISPKLKDKPKKIKVTITIE